MAIRKIKRYLKKRSICGSDPIYQIANSKIDQVTNKATGMKKIEYKSNLKLKLISKRLIFIHWILVIIDSVPWSKKISRGIKLIKKDCLIEILMSFGLGLFRFNKYKTRGEAIINRIRIIVELKIRGRFIAFT